MKAICLLCLLLAVGIRPAMAQNETAFGAELRREREEIKDSCTKGTLKGVGDCVVAVATQHPLHPAFGSIAPQSGFGAGLALVGHTNALSEDWRVDWNADGIATPGGSWRGGAYVMFNRSAVSLPTVTTGDVPAPTSDAIHPYPTFSAYVQET